MTSVSVLLYIGWFSIRKYYCHQFFPLFFRIQKRKSNFLDIQNTHSNDYTPTCNAVVPAHTFLPPSAGRGFLNDSQEEYIRCSRFAITSSLVGEVYPRKLTWGLDFMQHQLRKWTRSPRYSSAKSWKVFVDSLRRMSIRRASHSLLSCFIYLFIYFPLYIQFFPCFF